jgi:hypothetical protein
MKAFVRDNGLTLALATMFVFSLVGMILSGRATYNDDLAEHGRPPVGVAGYVLSGNFQSSLFENWESEFLQMATYVVLTAWLFQRGSSESRDPDDPNRDSDELSAEEISRSPIWSWVYSYSLGLTLAALFVCSFVLHWFGSFAAANEEARLHGGQVETIADHLVSSKLWFESFQNWQSEFLSTALLVVLSIVLRHKGSPESKPVAAGNEETGQ